MLPLSFSSDTKIMVVLFVEGELYGMIIRLGLSASLLAGRIAETPVPQLFPLFSYRDTITLGKRQVYKMDHRKHDKKIYFLFSSSAYPE